MSQVLLKQKDGSRQRLALCPGCGHFWNYRGTHEEADFVSCPGCKKAYKLGALLLQKVLAR